MVGSPWGTRQPEPYWDASEVVYHVALKKGTRSPFRENDELMGIDKKDEKEDSGKDKKKEKDKKEESEKSSVVSIDKDGIQSRIARVPLEPGNYYGLKVNDKALYMMSSETGVKAKTHLVVAKITNEDVKATKHGL